jgi:hypothetical protein
MRSAALLPLLVLLAVLPPVAGPAIAAGPGTAPAETTMSVALQNDGDARWNVTMQFRLADGNETAAFEDLAAAYEAGDDRVGPEVATFRALVRRADEATDRPMAVADVRREARILESGEAGTLTLEFTWTNFSAVENESLVVGGAFPAEWSLAADQRLILHPPPGYLLSTYFPGTDGGVQNGILRWDGPRTFAAGEPHVEYSLVGDGSGGTGAGTTPGGERAGNDPGVLAAGALLIAGAAAVAYVLAVRTRDPAGGGTGTGTGNGGDGDGDRGVATDGDAGARARAQTEIGTGTEAEAQSEAEEPGGVTSESGTGTGAERAETGGGDETGADAGGEAASESAPPPDLLSDEERVERLLRANGGRMKQARIVDETGWSNAKVSQLLSGMAEEERVEKLRIGRENLISLPGSEWDIGSEPEEG